MKLIGRERSIKASEQYSQAQTCKYFSFLEQTMSSDQVTVLVRQTKMFIVRHTECWVLISLLLLCKFTKKSLVYFGLSVFSIFFYMQVWFPFRSNFRQKLCDDCLLFAALRVPSLTIPNTVCPPFKARNHFQPDPLILNF